MATEDQMPSYYMVEDDDSIDADVALWISEFNGYPDGAGTVMALFPVDWTGSGGELVTLREDGTVALDVDGTFDLPEPFDRGTPPTMITTTTGMAVLKPDHPANQTIESGFQSVGVPVPEVVRALNAREAALTGDQAAIRAYTSEALGRWSGWNEPISTALLGNWADPLYNEGRLSPGALRSFLAEASVINQQLTPIWGRKANREYVQLLDAPLGHGMTFHDVLCGQPATDLSFEGFEDPRLNTILETLTADEQAVALWRSRDGITNWVEAAMAAGVPDPKAVGRRVRRKARRLAALIASGALETEAGTGNGR
ncbi:hypothetical protein [Streptomyces tauricus]|uniref:hypothetical protein n=1 Tax=Streptomyces tauricus TaxID=68274 RepID=UPI002244517D|nr:hypothetical protein [Streptomyces tauricus]MCW8103021.1 hypothetical protein [Streptomyces tauricus]